MTERSRYWDGTSVGDAASVAPYDAATEFAVVQASIVQAFAMSNRGGVLRDQLSELAATNPLANTVQIASGRAFVYGTWYENDAALNVTVPTPSASTRVDLIVLRKDWSAQTVRVTRIAGTEGAGAPSLTQSAGVTWDTPIVQASITTGGTITLTDQREWAPPHLNLTGESGDMHSVAQLSDLAAPTSAPPALTFGGSSVQGASGEYADRAHEHGLGALDGENLGRFVAARTSDRSGSISGDDDVLIFTLPAGTWVLEAFVRIGTLSAGSPGLATAVSAAGSSGGNTQHYVEAATPTLNHSNGLGATVSDAPGSTNVVRMVGVVTGGGVCKITYTSPDPLIIYAGSWMRAEKVIS